MPAYQFTTRCLPRSSKSVWYMYWKSTVFSTIWCTTKLPQNTTGNPKALGVWHQKNRKHKFTKTHTSPETTKLQPAEEAQAVKKTQIGARFGARQAGKKSTNWKCPLNKNNEHVPRPNNPWRKISWFHGAPFGGVFSKEPFYWLLQYLGNTQKIGMTAASMLKHPKVYNGQATKVYNGRLTTLDLCMFNL